jgi:hypothetical protein
VCVRLFFDFDFVFFQKEGPGFCHFLQKSKSKSSSKKFPSWTTFASAATPSAGVIEIRMTAQNASLSRVSEAIASLTNWIIPIFVTTFTLFVHIGGLRVPIPLSQCRG